VLPPGSSVTCWTAVSHGFDALQEISGSTDLTLKLTRFVTVLPPTRILTRFVTVTTFGVPTTIGSATVPRATIAARAPKGGVADATTAPITRPTASTPSTNARLMDPPRQ
jgi:hypothetical protein